MPRVDWDFMGMMRVPIPSLPEQRAITDYLDEETTKIDSLITKVEEAIERFKEYRTALISAAVTGKIDVRNVKEKIPC
jgi:restriction endonuclease S subunit